MIWKKKFKYATGNEYFFQLVQKDFAGIDDDAEKTIYLSDDDDVNTSQTEKSIQKFHTWKYILLVYDSRILNLINYIF